MSYFGSTISTGTNLNKIQVASLDLVHRIPFIFILVNKFLTPINIGHFIGVKIVNQENRALSRVSKNFGQFKILLLNKCLKKKTQNLTLNNFFNSNRFKEKFENFKVFELIYIYKNMMFYVYKEFIKKGGNLELI